MIYTELVTNQDPNLTLLENMKGFEITNMKVKLCNELYIEKTVTPKEPFNTMDKFKEFEVPLSNAETYAQLVKELSTESSRSSDKFIRNLGRSICSDNVFEQFSSRGISSKQCIRGTLVTSTIRNAFKKVFAPCQHFKVPFHPHRYHSLVSYTTTITNCDWGNVSKSTKCT
ncbi:uncharacterized protein LOC142230968 [Haematobia irritans]|uniref:uncharacterized protein LOC142230968 n=1 Tax=Haematobia irritans TaxID=7368 RepID=UPI003F502E7A